MRTIREAAAVLAVLAGLGLMVGCGGSSSGGAQGGGLGQAEATAGEVTATGTLAEATATQFFRVALPGGATDLLLVLDLQLAENDQSLQGSSSSTDAIVLHFGQPNDPNNELDYAFQATATPFDVHFLGIDLVGSALGGNEALAAVQFARTSTTTQHAFELFAFSLPVAPDRFEGGAGNDTAATAVPLTFVTNADGKQQADVSGVTIDAVGVDDRDFYSLTLSATTVLQFGIASPYVTNFTSNDDLGGYPALSLADGLRASLFDATDPDAADPAELGLASVEPTDNFDRTFFSGTSTSILPPGTYVIRVLGRSSGAETGYLLRVIDLDP